MITLTLKIKEMYMIVYTFIQRLPSLGRYCGQRRLVGGAFGVGWALFPTDSGGLGGGPDFFLP